ncbi:hypothetical protein M3Y99_00536100 [Aphelenchoides fujianensis]|nr:hypothetical protein M3Y99_00536100 [Aphelenchoides fujianensis]
MVNYKLSYFNSRGFAEPARMIFALAEVPFEDVRFEREGYNRADWPFGKVPVLEVDGKRLPESTAIIRFLARRHGLAGRDEWEAAEIDAIVDLWKDFFQEIYRYFHMVVGLQEGDKEAVHKAEYLPALERYVPVMERVLRESGNGFLHPSGLSWADLFFGDDFARMAALNEHCDRVHALPKIREWVAKRPDTKF